ncbi:MAG TPA: trehalose-6-phosphate synthase [Candidatus Eisenbacteria bacterium]|uniref:Glucosylglycerol-phosphate synthase n=1 Tax=Eiseniibacteriota bacterium TaxID=2212470 RepID=A0A7V2F3I9_UNCEI|nr:trehalose-6-phosphate synthase [Candidatus Eisenbacteria bacterium]
MENDSRKLIIASNRLPFILERDGGSWKLLPGSGGLVTALAPVLRDRGGIWIGWPGLSGTADISGQISRASDEAGFDMKPVYLDAEDVRRYYKGLSNEVLWPLFHDLQSYCNFDPSYWQSYLDINARFAGVIGEQAGSGDFIWVHDYHLLATGSEIRKAGISASTGFFLHIPFPPLDIFAKLPWRSEILRSMLDYDLIGFQTPRDRRNFIQCLRTFVDDIAIVGKGQVIEARAGEKTIRIGYFPISIDYTEFSQLAGSREVADAAWFIHEDIPKGKIVLGVDRLDYTKGIPYRLRAFEDFLEKHPELHRKITLVQVVVPSRRDIPVYEELKIEIERMVGEINGRFTRSGWVPIHYIFRSLSRPELLGYYRAAEIALLTPLKDGMNLVAKEYCASNIERSGVLILSEFAGAAPQMKKEAILVNPYNIEQVSDAIFQAWTMDLRERRSRMEKLQASVARNDIYWWVNSYLKASLAGALDDFPTVST